LTDTKSSRPPSSRIVSLVALVLIALFAFHVARFLEYVNDDAYITFRYSRNLASGVGPYFNSGEHVEGYTNLSLMLAMALVYKIGGEAAVPLASKGLGLLAGVVCVLLCLGIARRLSPRAGLTEREGLIWGTVAGGLVAIAPGFAVNSVSGLETAWLAAFLLAAVWCDSAESPGRIGVAAWLALAVLTRPEGILIAGVYLGGRLAQALWIRRSGFEESGQVAPILRIAALVGATFALQLIFRYVAYDGEFLPNTFYAKAGGFWGVGAWNYVRGGSLAPLLGLAGGALALLGWAAPAQPSREPLAPIALTALVGSSLPFVVGTDWMIGWRFSAPYLPLLALTFVFGWIRLTGRGGQRRERIALALVLALPIAWITQTESRRTFRNYVTVKARGYDTGHGAVAEWIRDSSAQPGDRIALMDIGIISYRSPEQRILDITGLTDRLIAKSPGEFLAKEYNPNYVLDQEPEFIVLANVVLSDPASPPDPNGQIHPWSPLEKRISDHPAFETFYRKTPEEGPLALEWSERYAQRLGAERVFLHEDPEFHYLLAVYRRQTP
jgi:arabinofuranosyltransferase